MARLPVTHAKHETDIRVDNVYRASVHSSKLDAAHAGCVKAQ